MHQARIKRHGDPDVVIKIERTSNPAYRTAHIWVQDAKGRAADHPCIDCGQQASEWAYDNADPDERVGLVNGSHCRYSASPDHYQPMCRPCHRRFDLQARNMLHHNISERNS